MKKPNIIKEKSYQFALRETKYWLRLLKDSRIYDKIDFSGSLVKSEEIIKLLTANFKCSLNLGLIYSNI